MRGENSFEKFGDEFQLKLVHYLVVDRVFSSQVLEILQPEYFTNQYCERLMQLIIAYYEKYETFPNFDNLETLVSLEVSDPFDKETITKLIKEIKSTRDLVDKQFIEEQTLKFCRQQAMRNAIIQSVEYMKDDNFEMIYETVKAALVAGSAKDLGHDYFTGISDRLLNIRNPISTGMKMLDGYIAGGLAEGELGIIMAATNVGKCAHKDTNVNIQYEQIIAEDSNGIIKKLLPMEIVQTQRGHVLAKDLQETDVFITTPCHS